MTGSWYNYRRRHRVGERGSRKGPRRLPPGPCFSWYKNTLASVPHTTERILSGSTMRKVSTARAVWGPSSVLDVVFVAYGGPMSVPDMA
eukprot:1626338-Rhodomonas_salina.2